MREWRKRGMRMLWLSAMMLVGLLAGCGTDDPPVISGIADRTTFVGQALDVPFTVTDEKPDALTFATTSGDATVVRDTDLDVLGAGTNRTLRITPAPQGHGTTTITVAARDSRGQEDAASFDLVVRRPFETAGAKLLAGDGATNDQLGSAVATSGEYAILGAPESASAKGAAYVYQRSGDAWVQVEKLTASDGAAGDGFGYSVTMSGEYAIVGARFDDAAGAGSGSAYVFRRNGGAWVQAAKLTASDAASYDYFGSSVSVSGEVAVVGAPGDGTNANPGAAYVFAFDGLAWGQVARLTASDGAASDYFGSPVAVDGPYVVVGAVLGDTAGTDSGSAYVFQRCDASVTTCPQPWVELGHLFASDSTAGDAFGSSVAVNGDYAIVGAPYADAAGNDSGTAYLFAFNGLAWAQVAKLTAADGAAGDYFGSSVAISGDYAVVGAPSVLYAGVVGTAYVFRHEGQPWTEVNQLTASDGATADQFGLRVAVSADYAVIGAPTADSNGSFSGAAYVFAK